MTEIKLTIAKIVKSFNVSTRYLVRKKPITSEIVGGHSAIVCHLMNQAYYNHAVIKWNPKKLKFAKGSGDPKWLTRDYRAPWKV